MNILIGEITSYKAIVIACYFNKYYPEVSIHTYDYNRFTSKIRTKYSGHHHLLKNENLESYLKEISKIIKQEQINLFIPVHSDYIGEILKNKKLFGNSLFYLGNYTHYAKLHDKRSLHSIANKLGLKVPLEYIDIKNAKIPFIGKPKKGSSAKGVVYILSEKDRKKFSARKFDNYIFQEYIKGIGCGYSVYAINGEIKTDYGHMRLAEYPVSGGSSVYRAHFFKEEMHEIAQKILSKIPWTGFAMFEFKLTPSDELVLIEVNPRIWGSINQGLQNDTNYFKHIIYSEKISSDPVKLEKFTFLSPHVYLSFLLYALTGNLKPLTTFIRNIRYNKTDVSVFNDPKAWLSMILRKIL